MFEDNNITHISRGKTIRKVKALEQYQKDYTIIKNIKQTYLNSLQHHVKYGTINIECHRIQQEVKILENQLADMESKLLLLKKELE